ncbi:aspartate aminotransferase family protein [Isoalcanivorax beigongshangi]|uniref:Acetylornithine aminotransferase n=1 Tax=Isoalcanivorax beigongshangi TaxID=3238810 RepID=A0ABV4AJ67_9GAMM
MNETYLIPTYARQPVTFDRGEGVWLYDTDHNAYLDAISGIGVCNLGHCHPAVTATLARQAETLVHTSNLYRIDTQEKLSQRLCALTGMDKVFFCNSGAEANEAALKLARLYGHSKQVACPTVVVLDNAFHGRTLFTLSATANPKAREGFDPMVSGFIRVPWNDLDAIRALGDNPDIVAVLVEPIQGEGGVHVPAADYLPGLRQLCDQFGWLLMLDEVQTGNGRTGDYFFYLGADVRPDVLTTAKGLGNGFPIGACLVSGTATDLMGPGSHGTTYGGNPLGCAVALTVLDEMTKVLPAVNDRGARLVAGLGAALADLGERVVNLRAKGLMVGIELDRDCGAIVQLARERGLLVNVTAGRVVRLLPPLVISEQEVDTLVARLSAAIHAFYQQEAA